MLGGMTIAATQTPDRLQAVRDDDCNSRFEFGMLALVPKSIRSGNAFAGLLHFAEGVF